MLFFNELCKNKHIIKI